MEPSGAFGEVVSGQRAPHPHADERRGDDCVHSEEAEGVGGVFGALSQTGEEAAEGEITPLSVLPTTGSEIFSDAYARRVLEGFECRHPELASF